MLFTPRHSNDHDADNAYTYRLNALIEHGRDDLIGDVVDEATSELDRAHEVRGGLATPLGRSSGD